MKNRQVELSLNQPRVSFLSVIQQLLATTLKRSNHKFSICMSQSRTKVILACTTLLQTDYYGLFRSRKYSGVDLHAQPDRYVSGSALDDEYKERVSIISVRFLYR